MLTCFSFARQHGMDLAPLERWRVDDDGDGGGRLLDPDGKTYKRLRDAFRAVYLQGSGRLPREDVYFLAILRRQLAELAMPLRDGPITVTALGQVVPREHFYTPKKLFPVSRATGA